MAKWFVCVTFDASKTIEVEAGTAEEAKIKAMDDIHASLCHQCAHEIELGDPLKAVDAWEA